MLGRYDLLTGVGTCVVGRVDEGGEGGCDVTALEYRLAIDREAPAVTGEYETSGIVVGCIDSQRGITSQATLIERMEAGVVQQTSSV